MLSQLLIITKLRVSDALPLYITPPQTTIQRRRAGVALRRDCDPNSKKLTNLEEEVIVRHILDLDLRGFAPSLGAVRDIADKLLTKRGAS